MDLAALRAYSVGAQRLREGKAVRKIFGVLLAALLVFIPVDTAAFAAGEDSMQIAYHLYVDPDASGPNTFATIDEARAYVRTLDKTKGDILVEIADGTYELEDTVVFEAADSGSDSCTVRYAAAEGASPVFSGGRRVHGTWQDEGGGIYSIAYSRDCKLRSLYVNGRRCYMTSSVAKGHGAVGEYAIEAASADWAWVSGTASDGVLLGRSAIPSDTRNPDDIELMTQTRWNTTIVCVDRLENRGPFVCARLQMPYGAIAQTLGWGNEYQFKENNMIFNVFEHLDEPGEFYFDRSGGRLYYYPREGEDLNTAEVVVPELETLFSVQGENRQNRVHNISFEGLTFAYTDWNLCEVAGSHGRATNQGAAALFAYAEEDWHGYIYRAYDVGPAVVRMDSAQDIRFLNNTVCHTGNDGLSLVNDAVGIYVEGNAVFDTAGAALLVGHPQHEYIGDKGSAKGRYSDREKYDAASEGACTDLLVRNNLFKDTSRLFWGVAGVIVYMADGMQFLHNQVENTPYSGISLGWGWWNFNGDPESVVPDDPSATMRNNVIRYNLFKNTITTLSDAGAIYTIGDMPGTIISENYIDSIGSPYSNNAYHIRGIHIDEGTRHVYGEKNVIFIDPSYTCIDCGDWGKKGDNTWDNNYSNAKSYTTTESYEPGTRITNAHYVPDADWDETACAVIENAGIETAYISAALRAAAETGGADTIHAIPDWKPNVGLIIAGAAAGAAVLGGAVFWIVKRWKKKKRASDHL